MITPKRPAGFHEFLPADQLAFNAMVTIIRQAYERHGFAPVETPALELAGVLHAKEGGETAKQGYRFTKGDTDLALRFDLTVPLARYVAEHYHELPLPFRRYQIQEVWRAEKPQAGRYRQFYQCDIDIIGSKDLIADADILITMHSTLQSLGLKQVVLHVSHRKIYSGVLESHKLGKHSLSVLRIIDKLPKQGKEKVKKDLLDLGLKNTETEMLLDIAALNGPADKILDRLSTLGIDNETFASGIHDLTVLNRLLKSAGLSSKNFVIDLGMVRGLDYYTGMVFEVMLPDYPSVGNVGGGGHYDNLLGHYHKENLSGVGGSIGLSRLFSALKNEMNDGPSSPAQALVVVFNEALLPYCFSVAETLRKNNLNIEIYPALDKAGKQLAYANKTGIPFALLCGEDEEKKKTVTIKNMKTGEQKSLPVAKVASYLKKN